jgi:hypothetical protein
VLFIVYFPTRQSFVSEGTDFKYSERALPLIKNESEKIKGSEKFVSERVAPSCIKMLSRGKVGSSYEDECVLSVFIPASKEGREVVGMHEHRTVICKYRSTRWGL